MRKCWNCKGQGEVWSEEMEDYVCCPVCDGRGYFEDNPDQEELKL